MYSTCQGSGRALTPCGTPSLSEKPLTIFQLATYLSFPEERGVFSFSATFSLPWIPEGTLFSALRRGTGRMGGGDNGTQNWPQFFSASSFSSSSSGLFSSLRAILVGGGRGTREKVPPFPYFFPSFFLLPLSDPRRVSLYVRSPPFVRRRRMMLVVSSSVPWRRRRPQTIISHTLLYGALLTLLHPSLRTLPRSKSQGGRRGEGEEKRVTPTQPTPLCPFSTNKTAPLRKTEKSIRGGLASVYSLSSSKIFSSEENHLNFAFQENCFQQM